MKQLEKIVQERLPRGGGHGLQHTLRVRDIALIIAKKEGADTEIVEAAALLHDICRGEETRKDGYCHAQEGAKEAAKILSRINFPEEKIEHVQQCIAVHRASKGLSAETLEAQIIQDADRIDVLGAIGIGRVFYTCGAQRGLFYCPNQKPERYAGKKKPAVNHLVEKSINTLSPESFNTKAGKKMAEQRYTFTKQFVEQFIAEWKQKK